MNGNALFQTGAERPGTKQKLILSATLVLLTLFFIIFTFVPAWMRLNTDFSNSYVASRLVLDGVFTEDVFNVPWFQRQMYYYGVEDQLGAFAFPPFSALIMVPIALFKLDPVHAKHVWLLLNLLFMLLTALLIRKFTGKGLIPIVIFFILSGTVLRNNFLFGQMYMLMLLTVAATLYFYQRGNDTLAGLMLAFGIVTREFPLFVLFYFLWKRQWRIVAYTFAWGLLLSLLSVSVMGIEPHLVFLRELHPQLINGMWVEPYTPRNQTINSLLHKIFIREPSLNPTPLLEAPFLYPICKILFYIPISLLTLSTINSRIDHRTSTRTAMEFCIFMTLALLLSSFSATYTYLLWILPMAIFANALHRDKKYGPLAFLLLLYLAIGSDIANKTMIFSEGLTVFMAYPRLWVTFAGLITMLIIYRNSYGQGKHTQPERVAAYSIAGLILIVNIAGNTHYFSPKADGAVPLKSDQSHLITSPTNFRDKLIYSALQMRGYVLMDEDGPLGLRFPGDMYTPRVGMGGDLMAFEGIKDRRSRIYLYKDGQAPVPITDPASNAQYPAFRGNANEIAYVSNHSGDYDVYLTKFNDGPITGRGPTQPIRLAASPAEEIEPYFSPDGDKLVYASNLTGTYKLYIMSLVARGVKQITFGPSTERHPCWSPDGRYIAFSSNRGGNWDIWLYDVQSSALRQVSRDVRSDTNPCWTADSTSIIFTSDRWRGAEFPALYKIKAH